MKKINIILKTLMSLSLIFGAICASNASSTSGGLVLKQAVGARAQGMGNAFTAVADDATSVYWNVAGMTQLAHTQVSASYLLGLFDSSYGQVMFTKNLGQVGTLGVGLILSQAGDIVLDDLSNGERTVSAQTDLVGQVAYAYNLNPVLSIGLGLKILDSTLIEEYTATAFAADAGLLANLGQGFKVGLSVRNVGTELKYAETGDALPLTIQGGVSYQLSINSNNNLLVAADLVKENDQDIAVHTGAEYWYAKMLALRAGYKIGYEQENLTAGLGVRWQMMELAYSFGMMQELDHTHKVSLAFSFK